MNKTVASGTGLLRMPAGPGNTVALIFAVFVVSQLLTTWAFQLAGRNDYGSFSNVGTAIAITGTVATLGLLSRRYRLAFATGLAMLVAISAGQLGGAEAWFFLVLGALSITRLPRPSVLIALSSVVITIGVVGTLFELSDSRPGIDLRIGLLVQFAIGVVVGVIGRYLIRRSRNALRAVEQAAAAAIEVRTAERKSLAEDLQAAIHVGLRATRKATDPDGLLTRDLRARLDRIDRVTRTTLTQLRALLTVLREQGSDESTPRPIRWPALTAVGYLATGLVVVATVDTTGSRMTLVIAALTMLLGLWEGLLPWSRVRGGIVFSSVAAYLLVHWVHHPSDGAIRFGVTTVGLTIGLATGKTIANSARFRRAYWQNLLDLDHARALQVIADRNEVARELHDVVARQLTLTSMQVMACSGSDDEAVLRRALERIRSHTNSAEVELAVLLENLRGEPAGEQLPLDSPLSVARSAQAVLAQHGYRLTLNIDPMLDRVDEVTQRTINRALQETTTNILRYSQPSASCVVTAKVQHSHVQLCVTSPLAHTTEADTCSTGHGLAGLAERVDLCHGTMTAGPVASRSWRVAIDLPLADATPVTKQGIRTISQPQASNPLPHPKAGRLVPTIQ